MPRKIIDDRVRLGKMNRNKEICAFFEKLYNAGYRYEVIEEKIILKWGLSSSTINQIIKGYGHYRSIEAPTAGIQLRLWNEEE